MKQNKKRTVLLVSVAFLTLGLGVVAVVTALRLRQLEPVAPTAPTSRPAAQEFIEIDPQACVEEFSVVQNSCDEWCDSNDDCSTGYCYIAEGFSDGVCRDAACPETAGCECPSYTVCNTDTLTCETVDGVGENECVGNEDCQPVVHTECQDYSCVEVVGAGNNECRMDTDDCLVTHAACVNEMCVAVVGSGTDECTIGNDVECAPNVEEHLECIDGNNDGEMDTCSVVEGPGDDMCADDVDCVPDERLVCQNEACVTVSGSGENECVVDNDCVTPTHLECVNNACAVVTGGGVDQCMDDVDCQPDTTPTPVPPTATPVPGQPTNTPAPTATTAPMATIAPTAVPTATPVELPQAGITAPTLILLTFGSLVLLAGVAGVLVW